MFTSLLALASLTTLAFAGPLNQFDGLAVTLSAPSTDVTSLDDLKVVAEVTNNGAESVKLLKYGTILDNVLPTRSFSINKQGADVAFTGIKLSVSLEDADDTAYTVIAPGQSITVTHEVGALFDFESAGAGAFEFSPVTTFQLSEPQAKVNSLSNLDKVSATSGTITINISGDIKKRSVVDGLDKRAVDTCTNSTRKSFIDGSYTEAKQLGSLSASYVNSNGRDSLFTAYYGASSTTTVRNVFTAVANENSSSRTLGCTDPLGACTSGVIAYTVISNTNIYFCSLFFSEVTSSRLCSGTTVASRNVRGGTTLHELTHATSGTDDVTYGCAADQALSDSNSIRNADNYNCFATQVYQNTQC